MDFASSRREYKRSSLAEREMKKNPFQQFSLWLEEAVAAGSAEANTMTLATSSPEGFPSCRVVLLKELDHKGFVFYTNYNSRKGKELLTTPRAAAVFYWPELERQVRVEGMVEQLSRNESALYFNSRPRGSRLSAFLSPQSEVIPDRGYLEEMWENGNHQYPGDTVPLPVNWGGFRIIPHTIEFFQGREHRLHDRIRYRLLKNEWIMERLAP